MKHLLSVLCLLALALTASAQCRCGPGGCQCGPGGCQCGPDCPCWQQQASYPAPPPAPAPAPAPSAGGCSGSAPMGYYYAPPGYGYAPQYAAPQYSYSPPPVVYYVMPQQPAPAPQPAGRTLQVYYAAPAAVSYAAAPVYVGRPRQVARYLRRAPVAVSYPAASFGYAPAVSFGAGMSFGACAPGG